MERERVLQSLHAAARLHGDGEVGPGVFDDSFALRSGQDGFPHDAFHGRGPVARESSGRDAGGRDHRRRPA